MDRIVVLIKEDRLIFDKYEKEISDQNLNNTNVINTKNLKFSYDYINENLDLVSAFFELIMMKFNLNKAEIKTNSIAEIALLLLSKLHKINYVYFKEDSTLSYTVCDLIYKNKNIKKVNCFNLPEIMFKRFNKDVITTRSNIIEFSEFFKYNEIKTYSDIYNKKVLIIDELFSNKDIDELKYFIENNSNLKKIIFRKYSVINIKTISKLLHQNNHKNVLILIIENETNNKDILENISFFSTLEKKYNVKIKIKYSKKYKSKNILKEFNYIFIKIIILSLILFCILIVLLLNNNKKDEYDSVENSLNVVQEIKNNSVNVDETLNENEEYVSSYYTNYAKLYSDLLNINSDCVGWIVVNKTKIDYPVVQYVDNDYYLNHSFDKSKNSLGWIFVDYRNNLINDFNTIIYAHSGIENGLMFSTLKNVLNSDWYTNEDNYNIIFSIKGVEYTYKVFSVYTLPNSNDYLNVNFNNISDKEKFIKLIKDRSIYDFNIDVTSDSQILTLSTCYNNSDYRVVLHAKREI